MRIKLTGMIVAMAIGCLTQSAGAFWLDALFDRCEKGYEQNHRWPSPYLCPDRKYASLPFDTMIRNGWRRQNLLGSHHFNEGSTELTQAGQLKVRWIMANAPTSFRQIFVERSFDLQQTEQRIATANKFVQAVAEGAPGISAPLVADTHIMSEGRPAATVDFVNSQFRDNMRPPVLPATSLGGGSTTP